jgi:hypothetical protein
LRVIEERLLIVRKRKGGKGLLLFPLYLGQLTGLDLSLGPTSRLLFSQLGPASLFAWFFIMLASSKLLLHSAALNQFLEAAECHANRFLVMYPHS